MIPPILLVYISLGCLDESSTARVECGLSNSLSLSLREWPRLPFTARIERAQFHRARSASKKGTWPLPPLLADCFSILLANSCNPRHHSHETRSTAHCRPRGWDVASNCSTASLQPTGRPFNSHRQKWNMALSSPPIARQPDAGVSPEPGFPLPVPISTVPLFSE